MVSFLARFAPTPPSARSVLTAQLVNMSAERKREAIHWQRQGRSSGGRKQSSSGGMRGRGA